LPVAAAQFSFLQWPRPGEEIVPTKVNDPTPLFGPVKSAEPAMIVKKDGKVTATGRIIVSADGKSRTVTTGGTDAEGKKVSNKVAYDKQQ